MDRVDFLILWRNLFFWNSFQKYHILFLSGMQVSFYNKVVTKVLELIKISDFPALCSLQSPHRADTIEKNMGGIRDDLYRLDEAMKLAYEAHHGQVDKGGMPYVFHPFHLAEQMDDEISTVAALLHDVVEDTDWTLEALAAEGFPAESLEVLQLLTHPKEEPYMDYIARLQHNPIAVKIKLADLRHNSDFTRLSAVTASQKERLRQKYTPAFALLEGKKYDAHILR